MAIANDILTDLRQLLLAFVDVTDLVSDRIRPHQADASDGNADLIILDLPDADQWNTLDGTGFLNGDVVVEARSTNKTTAAAIAEAVASQNETPSAGLDGYRGPAGTGEVIQSVIRETSQNHIDDDDADSDTIYTATTLYSVWYQPGTVA